ncbi:MAG: acetyl/propionyl/methylcrotonyl-CoA carboxylase subunit alpha, partial [Gaiellales bacterium]
MSFFSKVLVANRGEIAVRVFRALRELGIGTVAVYSDVDRASLHAVEADEAYLIGPGPPAESYLAAHVIIDTAQRAGADAIHPGYGFLAENAGFARACIEAGLAWIGPPPSAIAAMGSKVTSRQLMAAAGVPIIPGTTEPVTSSAEIVALGEQLGWPITITASAGGGGRGLRVASDATEVERAVATVRREGEAYFGDASMYVEKYLEDPRHVEVQILADAHGKVVHLGERDCTIQRRHQKLIEETPSPAVGGELRQQIGQIAIQAARAVDYRSAGTIEGLLDAGGNYYFLEMNTRIQVEHTVTELVTGIDLVREQVRIAAGEPIAFEQEDVTLRGHAIECRINAENPSGGFLPTPGTITAYREPGGPGVRVDSGVRRGSEVTGIYDPLIAKLCTWDVDREAARRRMLRALEDTTIEGVSTLIGFHRALLSDPCFIGGETCRDLVESTALAERARAMTPGPAHDPPSGLNPNGRERVVLTEVDGRRFTVRLQTPEPPHAALARRRRLRVASGAGGDARGRNAVASPMQGTIIAVEVAEGDRVAEGQIICVIEAMKMENEIPAPRDGLVQRLSVSAGSSI